MKMSLILREHRFGLIDLFWHDTFVSCDPLADATNRLAGSVCYGPATLLAFGGE